MNLVLEYLESQRRENKRVHPKQLATDLFQEHEALRTLKKDSLEASLKEKSPLALFLHQKLVNSLKETQLRATQSSLEMDRRLEAARLTRENLVAAQREENNGTDALPLATNEIDAADDHEFTILRRMLPLKRQYVEWFSVLSEAIEKEQTDIQNQVSGYDRQRYGPYLMLLPADLLAILTIQELLHMSFTMPEGVPFVTVSTRIGRAVFDEVNLFKTRNSSDIWKELKRKLIGDSDKVGTNSRKAYGQAGWDDQTTAKIGSILLDLLCKNTKILLAYDPSRSNDEPIPAFYHTHAFKPPKTIGVIVAHRFLHLRFTSGAINIDEETSYNEDLAPNIRPMITMPKPWTNSIDGGYLHQRHTIVRATRGNGSQLQIINEAVDSCGILKEGLNSLGKVAWEVNKDVYDVAVIIRQRDLQVTGLPSPKQIDEMIYPKRPVATSRDVSFTPGFKKIMQQYKDECERIHRKKQEFQSKIMDYDAKVDTATHLIPYPRFWFPYSVDFRGRAYPIPPVSHLGDDLARSMFTYNRRKPLGERGLYWLKVHLANHMGNDKVSFDDRVAWIDERMDKVLDSAQDPLDTTDPTVPKWWTAADNPFQALATCKEIAAAVACPDPREFMSNLPVHQDGSCNGLQHYAALGRDRDGGQQVNLCVSSKPGDVYTAVADKVRKELETVAASYEGTPTKMLHNTPEARTYIAHIMKDQISRKLVKQTVMTSVYGVTFIGARNQIQKRIEEQNDKNIRLMNIGEESSHVLTREEVTRASNYIAKVTLDAIGDTFQSARDIKEWLKDCAKVVCSSDQPMSWVTPVGLPVVQPYRNKMRTQIRTVLQHVVIAEHHDDMPINKQKQQTAFPPNFIHSLDSTHMILTAIACDKKDIMFTAVHDSYWTHAGDVEAMNSTLREQFVELHGQELLVDLRTQLVSRYPQYERYIREPPIIGSLDIKEVLNSPYFFN